MNSNITTVPSSFIQWSSADIAGATVVEYARTSRPYWERGDANWCISSDGIPYIGGQSFPASPPMRVSHPSSFIEDDDDICHENFVFPVLPKACMASGESGGDSAKITCSSQPHDHRAAGPTAGLREAASPNGVVLCSSPTTMDYPNLPLLTEFDEEDDDDEDSIVMGEINKPYLNTGGDVLRSVSFFLGPQSSRYSSMQSNLPSPSRHACHVEDSCELADDEDVIGIQGVDTASSSAFSLPERPVVEPKCVPLADLGGSRRQVGCGGDRGSRVYSVSVPGFYGGSRGTVMAHKAYPHAISSNELAFINTIADLRIVSEGLSLETSRNPHSIRQTAINTRCPLPDLMRGAQHLVLPDAVVVENNSKSGLLMPLYDFSLKQFLADQMRGLQRSTQGLTTSMSQSDTTVCCGRFESFLSQPRYKPLDSMSVIAAIAYQLLEGIVVLNHCLPHYPTDLPSIPYPTVQCTGFTHNDIHLDNILLRRDGNVALCDFELVEHIPLQKCCTPPQTRLPPSSRQSPHGLFCESADIWAFGLVILNLLTGVDPLFSDEKLLNDFGPGPLLLPYESRNRGAGTAVVDWEANVEEHVLMLLNCVDASGERTADAKGLLKLCGECLVNRPGVLPPKAKALLNDPVFKPFREDPQEAANVIRKWMEGCLQTKL